MTLWVKTARFATVALMSAFADSDPQPRQALRRFGPRLCENSKIEI